MGRLGWDLEGQSSISPSAANYLGHSWAITSPHPPTPVPANTYTLVSFLICKKKGIL